MSPFLPLLILVIRAIMLRRYTRLPPLFADFDAILRYVYAVEPPAIDIETLARAPYVAARVAIAL